MTVPPAQEGPQTGAQTTIGPAPNTYVGARPFCTIPYDVKPGPRGDGPRFATRHLVTGRRRSGSSSSRTSPTRPRREGAMTLDVGPTRTLARETARRPARSRHTAPGSEAGGKRR